MPEAADDKLRLYHELLRKWQQSINLISPLTLDEAWQRHFEDSLQLAALLPPDVRLYDLGSGAGFPGMVLAIARPDVAVTLIESDTKKCTFLSTVSRETKTPVYVLNQRIESVSRETIPDFISARALASLDKLLGYCLPFAEANPALQMLFMKGRKATEEIEAARLAYDFEVELIPSCTDEEGCILRLTNLTLSSGG